MHPVRLYFRYAAVSWRAQLAYRASFVLQTIGTGLLAAGEFVVIWALFDRFRSIDGWSLAEVAVFYGTVNIAWAVAEAFARGFDDFGALVKSGDFDRVLLRPRSTVLQVLGREFTLRRIGRLAQGAAVLAWGWATLGLGADPGRLALWLASVGGGVAFFVGLLLLQATLAFWTVESLEVMNVLTYGGVATTQYPLSIYPEWLRRFFTYLVPLACVSYFPLVAVLGREDPLGTGRLWQVICPLLGPVFLAMALGAWRAGVAHYRGTGS